MKLEEIDRNGTLQGFVLVRSCERKSAKNGSVYLDLVITDGETDVVAKIWDFRGTPTDQPEPNTVIRVRGTLSTYNGQPQFKIDRYRASIPEDGVKISDFIPTASVPSEDMFEQLIQLINAFTDEDLKKLSLTVLTRNKEQILNLPAASKLHHAIRGGLMMHTLSICRLALAVSALYPSVDKDLLLTGAILHDIAKAQEFNLASTGLVDGYTVSGILVGHLVRGAMTVSEIGKELDIDEQVLTLVEHMLISHHGQPEFGVAVRPMFLEAEILSMLDTMDADIYEIETAVKGLEPGAFSNKIWALDDRRFYNHGRKTVVTDVTF